MQNDAQKLYNARNGMQNALQKKVVVSEAKKKATTPFGYVPFSLNDVRTGLKAMFGKRPY